MNINSEIYSVEFSPNQVNTNLAIERYKQSQLLLGLEIDRDIISVVEPEGE